MLIFQNLFLQKETIQDDGNFFKGMEGIHPIQIKNTNDFVRDLGLTKSRFKVQKVGFVKLQSRVLIQAKKVTNVSQTSFLINLVCFVQLKLPIIHVSRVSSSKVHPKTLKLFISIMAIYIYTFP